MPRPQHALPGFPIERVFQTMGEVDAYFNELPDKLTCLLCGRQLRRLVVHLSLVHELSGDEYRAKYGIPWSHGLTSEDERKGYVARSENRLKMNPNHLARMIAASRHTGSGERRDYCPAVSKVFSDMHANPEYQEKMRQVGVQIAASPEGKRRLAESNSNAEHNERRRLNLASLNLDPAFRQKISEHLTSAKHRQHLRKIVDDPAFRQSQQQRMQTLWDAVRAAGCRTFAEYKALETGGTAQAGK